MPGMTPVIIDDKSSTAPCRRPALLFARFMAAMHVKSRKQALDERGPGLEIGVRRVPA